MPRVLTPFGAGGFGTDASVPAQFTYGCRHFAERGYDLVAHRPIRSRQLSRLTLRLSRRLPARTDVERQLGLVRAAGSCDIVFCPQDIDNVVPFAFARACRIVRTPLVTLMHHPPFSRGPRAGRLVWPLVASASAALPTLSAAVADELERLRSAAGKVVPLTLGPDATYYPASTYPGHGVVSIGKSLRDFDTLGRALTRAGVTGTIVCPSAAVTPAFASFGPTVTVSHPRHGLFAHRDTLPFLAQARAVAIPLASGPLLAGTWSLLDALGMGKAVLVTRQPLLGIDVEKEGIGYWLPPGDIDAWVDAIRHLDEHPDEAAAMGRRARELVDDGLDSRRFAHGIMDIFDKVLGIDTTSGRDR